MIYDWCVEEPVYSVHRAAAQGSIPKKKAGLAERNPATVRNILRSET